MLRPFAWTWFDRFQTIRNKCQHYCSSMQTDTTSHNIVGPNNVGCYLPTMLGPFAWALSCFSQREFQNEMSECKISKLELSR